MNYFELIKKYINSEQALVKNKSYLSYDAKYNLKKSTGKINVCVIYPNTYELGMNNLGYLIVCDIVSTYKDVQVDRSFYYEEYNEVRGFLSGRKLCDFDVLIFSIPYELDVLNISKILHSGQISENYKRPLIIAGGTSIMINPNICNHFADLTLIGDAEILLPCLFDFLINNLGNIDLIIEKFKNEPGFYFPKHGVLNNVLVKQNKLNKIFYSPVVSPHTVFKETVLIDAGRGCPYDCKFCVTGNYFKPVIPVDALDFIPIINNCKDMGLVNFGIVSSFVGKIKNFKNFLKQIGGVKINVSSLRFEDIDEELLDLLSKNNQKIITLAPETGCDKLRLLISKKITNAQIIEKVKLIHLKKLSVKLYFIFGLPNETSVELGSIAELIRDLRKTGNVKAGLQPFVPKPHTPLAGFKFEGKSILKSKKKELIKKFREYKIPLNTLEFGSIKEAYLEYQICQSTNINDLIYKM